MTKYTCISQCQTFQISISSVCQDKISCNFSEVAVIRGDTQACGLCEGGTYPSRPYSNNDQSECRVCKYYNHTYPIDMENQTGYQTVCEDPEDSENCRLMYMDS